MGYCNILIDTGYNYKSQCTVMIRQSLFRHPSCSLAVLKLFTFSCRRFNGGRRLKWMQINRHDNCTKFRKPAHCFDSINKRWYADDPNCIRITLPALSPTMETGKIIKWHKKEGDKVNEGDVLADIETDKATIGFESQHEGYLAKIVVPEGTGNVPVNQLVCVMVENEADIKTLKEECYAGAAAPAPAPAAPAPAPAAPAPAPAAPPPPPKAAAPAPPPPAAAAPPRPAGKRVFASPLAVKEAAQKGIDLQAVAAGSGILNSIKSIDIPKDITKPAAGTTMSEATAAIISELATDLLISKQTVPHFYLVADVNINRARAACDKFNKKLKDDQQILIKDFVLKATALACLAIPEANSFWMGTFIRQYAAVHLNVTIYVPSGMVVGIISNAEIKSLSEIHKALNVLTQKAKDQQLEPQDTELGTITVSHLGKYDISTFAPIVRPPQSCSLAVGAIEKTLSPAKNSKGFQENEHITVTISCDHRVVDGAKGAEWLQKFKTLMEDPDAMLL